MTLLRIWLIASFAFLAAAAVWAFAPILLFVVLLTAALGLLSVLVIRIAHAYKAWHGAGTKATPPPG